MGNVISLKPWKVFEMEWGAYVTDSKGKIYNIFLKPDGQAIDTKKLNVIVHENGIEFISDDIKPTK